MDKGLSKAQENLPGFENLSLRQKYLLGQCFEKLSRRGQNDLIDCVSSLIAAANEVSPATGNKMNKFLSSELAASGPVKKATHGFSIENAADGRIAIQFSKIQGDGTTVTYQFCSGVVGLSRGDLRIYGNEKLHGAELGLYSEFEDIVKQELLPAVKGLTVERKELQTEDDDILPGDPKLKGYSIDELATWSLSETWPWREFPSWVRGRQREAWKEGLALITSISTSLTLGGPKQ